MIKLVNLRKQYLNNKILIEKNIKKVIKNSNFIMGSEVRELEKELTKVTKSKFCLTVSSGTDALLISLMSINLKMGDEVIVPGFTYISPVEAIVRLGAIPIFVDVHRNSGNIDTNLIEKKITKKTKAIIFVNLFGNLCNIEELIRIKKKNKTIVFIEDGAQSLGATYKKFNSCNTLDISCTSFFPTKTLGCYGDGGAIFTNQKKTYEKAKMIREHGQKIKYHHDIVGIGGRLDTIQAAILLAKLKKFKKEIILRKINYRYYERLFNKINEGIKTKFQIRKFKFSVNGLPNYASYNILIEPSIRLKLINYLNKKKISSMIYYPKIITEHKPYKKFSTSDLLINSKFISRRVLSLPFDPYIEKKTMLFVAREILKFISKYK